MSLSNDKLSLKKILLGNPRMNSTAMCHVSYISLRKTKKGCYTCSILNKLRKLSLLRFLWSTENRKKVSVMDFFILYLYCKYKPHIRHLVSQLRYLVHLKNRNQNLQESVYYCVTFTTGCLITDIQ